MTLDEAADFLAANHRGFDGIPHSFIVRLLAAYEKTTIARFSRDGKLTGLAVYQVWPERYNFLLICTAPGETDNLTWFRAIVAKLNDKPLSWYDEQGHEVRELCHS